jgi:surface antigen
MSYVWRVPRWAAGLFSVGLTVAVVAGLAAAPAAAGTGRVPTVAGLSAAGRSAITATSAPVIKSVSPAEGAPGWKVKLSGAGFVNVLAVRFGGVAARFTVVSSTVIRTRVPAGAASGPIVVKTAAGKAQAAFTVTPRNELVSSETLPAGDSLTSTDGHFRLTMQAGGNLVETTPAGTVLWASGTSVTGSVAVMQADGNLVVYAPGATAVWSSGTGGHPAAAFYLTLQIDANLVIYTPDGSSTLWDNGAVDSTLQPGEVLSPGQYLESPDRHFTLIMQGDGNLVEYVTGGHAVWASNTAGHSGAYLIMQGDGNLVIYQGGTALWASGTGGQGPSIFSTQVDANLVVYQGGRATWASGSYDSTLQPGETLYPGWYLESGNGYQLVMQGDGNLVEYGSGGPMWASNTAGHSGARVVMQASDGNLVIYQGGTALWASNTAGHPGAVLVDQQDGNQVIYQGGTALWASKSSGSPITFGQWPGTSGPKAAAQYYGYPYPNAPQCTAGTDTCVPDAWNFYQGQCTSWVAYRLNQLNGIAFSNSFGGGGTWGNANNWGPHAQALGIAVNSTPAVGSVAWYSSGQFGHVAYVEQVNSPTSIVISEMNYDLGNGFWVHTITTSSGWPTAFIHIHDR